MKVNTIRGIGSSLKSNITNENSKVEAQKWKWNYARLMEKVLSECQVSRQKSLRD